MKKIILLVWLLGLGYGTMAQNRSISFETTKEWKRVVNKARKEKKLIFVDCYTDWCGPCKLLATNVFTRDEVADYFNRHFVNAKFEMEKDKDGILLKGRFGIKVFPTLIFVDPKTQEVVHQFVGYRSGTEWLIEGASIAGDPLNSLRGLVTQYEAGKREPLFMSHFLKALYAAYMLEELERVAVEYQNSLAEEQFVTKENWEMIQMYVNDPLSSPLRSVMLNRAKFYAIAGKDVVDRKLEQAIKRAATTLAAWKSTRGTPFDEARNDALIKYLQVVDCEAAPVALAYLYTARYVREKDFRGVLNSMNEACKYNLFRGREEGNFFRPFIESLSESQDSDLVKEGVAWIDQRCANTDDSFYKASLMNSKNRLLESIGDTAGAEKARLAEEQYRVDGEQKQTIRTN